MAEIAFALGFIEVTHFNNFFKNIPKQRQQGLEMAENQLYNVKKTFIWGFVGVCACKLSVYSPTVTSHLSLGKKTAAYGFSVASSAAFGGTSNGWLGYFHPNFCLSVVCCPYGFLLLSCFSSS
ncbi:MAG: hypothetical protein R2822_09340 [Spirosomataceae bacterium]